MTEQLDVLIVGAGPVGLTLACDLIRRGAAVRIIDKSEHGFSGSRAKGIQPRTQEVFDDLGVLADIQEHSTKYPKLGLHLGPLTVPKTMIRHHEATDDVPYPDTLLIAQYDTGACLRRRLTDLGGQVVFSTALAGYEDRGDHVVATVEGPAGQEDIRCRFLVGADGGASVVRKRAGIGFEGSTDESDRMILADVLVDGLSRDRWHMWPRRAGRFTALCPLPGGERFQLMIRLGRDETPSLDLASISARVRDVTGLEINSLTWTSVWRPNVRLAERYRQGNIFLAGDAAHVHPPAGAQGLNTGVQDAYNLGWKLGQALAGAPDALLDTYDAERRPVAASVLGLSSELYKDIADRPLAAMKRGDEERQLTLSYRGGPLALGRSNGDETVQAGDRAPDARFTDPDGHSQRLFDVFRGPHFTRLILGDPAQAQEQQGSWPHHGATLKTVRLAGSNAAGLQRAYGLSGPAQILVRPDGYVAYVSTRDHESELALAAHTLAPGERAAR